MSLLAATLAVTLAACSSSQERRERTAPNVAVERAGPDDPATPAAGDGSSAIPGPPVTEAVARALLARRFRDAGWRIRSDVRVTSSGNSGDAPDSVAPDSDAAADPSAFELTVDGYDPEARIGFEYIDPSEAGADLSPTERTALASNSTHRILIVDPADSDRVLELADRFLARHAAP